MGFAHESFPAGATVEWLTPPEIIRSLGEFDLDPCSPINRPWDTAKKHLTVKDDGLLCPWEGRVWMNPPYGHGVQNRWLKKLSEHGDGTALIFARTETNAFHEYVWSIADAILFLRRRIYFCSVDGVQRKENNSGSPSVLIAYGKQNVSALKKCDIDGKFIDLRKSS